MPDVKRLFEAVQEKRSRQINFVNRSFLNAMPRGYDDKIAGLIPRYHQQGVQRLLTGGFVVSGSTPTGSASYFYVTDRTGAVINLTLVEEGDFSHAGGIQVCGDLLAVGVENPSKSSAGSRVYFYDLSNPSQPRKLALVLERPHDSAGAVGIARTARGLLCVVGNHDSERLDFYHFTSPESADGGGVRSFGHDVSASGWQKYQNLNLFVDTRQNVWIIGMHTDKVPFMKDWADLWRVTFPSASRYQLSKQGKKHHISSTDGARFLWGSGYCYNPARSRFEVFSVEACMNRSGVSRAAAWY